MQNKDYDCLVSEDTTASVQDPADPIEAPTAAEAPTDSDGSAAVATPTPILPPKRRKRRGDRRDGRRLRTVSAMSRCAAYLMDERCGTQNYIHVSVNCEKIDRYLREKKAQGYAMSFMHVLFAAYVRTVAEYPGINRFISGNKIFARNRIELLLVLKREMSLLSPDTVVKGLFQPDATIFDIYNDFERLIADYRNDPGGDYDKTVERIARLPGFLIRWGAKLLRGLDYIGKMPKSLLEVSPFHGSLFVTSMGSLGIPPIYHHLYDFGNVPVFISFGAKYRKVTVDEEGNIKKDAFVDFTVVMDERICDGYYYAAALKYMQRIFRNPQILDTPPAVVRDDID